jgi:ADP-heptose:LPS heptosyltransferase
MRAVRGQLFPRYKQRDVTLFVGSDGLPLGDNLLLTAVAREIKKRNADARITIITNRPEIFERNPDIDHVKLLSEAGKTELRTNLISYKHGFPYRKHFLQYCCECVNITDAIELRTYIHPAAEDWAWAKAFVSQFSVPPILISRGAGSQAYRKTWPLDAWKKIVAHLARFAPVVEVGAGAEPLGLSEDQCLCLSGKTTVHQLAALMKKSQALIAMDSGPMHLAAAVDLPTVCLLGGVYPPIAVSYPNFRILSNRPPCADCAPLRQCDFGTQCLANIKVQDVLAALDALCPGISANSSASKTSRRPRSSDFCHPSSVR